MYALQKEIKLDPEISDGGELYAEKPDLADIIPAASQLSGRLTILESRVSDLLDATATVSFRSGTIYNDRKKVSRNLS